MTTKEAIEYITSTTREFLECKNTGHEEGCADIMVRWGAWGLQNGSALMEAASPNDKPATIAALWTDTIGSIVMTLGALGNESMPAVRLLQACLAFAEEAEKYAETQD